MKKIRRIFSFALALVFCFTAMSTIVLATYPTCTHSSVYHSYVPMGGSSAHYIYCELCDDYIGDEGCERVYPGFDCTNPTYCMWCDRTLSNGEKGHTPMNDRWEKLDDDRHMCECSYQFSATSKCTGTIIEAHEYGNDNVCNKCSYVSQ